MHKMAVDVEQNGTIVLFINNVAFEDLVVPEINKSIFEVQIGRAHV